MPLVAGLDGCRGGWILARLDTASRHLTVELAAAWPAEALGAVALAAVDMPIGLADAGPRACDLAARALLPRGRKASVFAPPRRYMLDCQSWPQAQAAGRQREGVGLSKQSWHLIPKIAEIDRAIAPGDQARLREAHPELIFHHLNGWQSLTPKKTPEGAGARRALLAGQGIELPPGDSAPPRRLAATDDLLDAAACALTAERILDGRGCRLPETPIRDGRGLRMEIWY